MKENKYRAWLIEEKKMYEVNAIHFGAQYGMAPSDRADCVELYTKSQSYIDGIEVETMRYVGLNDKNGQEIYKGDIVRGIYSQYGQKIEQICEVKYNEQMLLIPFHEVIGYHGELWMDEATYEVVGNVYEHGHLLEKQEVIEHE